MFKKFWHELMDCWTLSDQTLLSKFYSTTNFKSKLWSGVKFTPIFYEIGPLKSLLEVVDAFEAYFDLNSQFIIICEAIGKKKMKISMIPEIVFQSFAKEWNRLSAAEKWVERCWPVYP